MKRVIYKSFYKLLVLLSNKFNNSYINRYKIIIGTSLLILTSCQTTKRNKRNIPAIMDEINVPQNEIGDTIALCYYVPITEHIDTIKNDTTVYPIVNEMPEFPGGLQALSEFINQNLRYPTDDCIQGRVVIQFVVEPDGTITNPVIKRSLGELYDKEALRIINIMPLWIPGSQYGTPKRVLYTLPISFRFNQSIKQDTLVYEVVEQMPEFPDGQSALMSFLNRNLKCPAICREEGIQGKTIVEFIIEKDGTISTPVIIRSVDEELDKEVLRIIRLMPKWKPGYHKGKAKRVKYTIPIQIHLQ